MIKQTKKAKVMTDFFAIFLIATVSWIFLPRLWFLACSIPLGYICFSKIMKQRTNNRKKLNLLRQERLFFESLQSNLVGMQNLSQAMHTTYHDLAKLFDENEEIMVALKLYLEAIQTGEGQERALDKFASALGDPLLSQFSTSLSAAYYQGLDLDQLISSYHLVLVDFQDLADEKEAKLLSSRKEQALLFILPFIMLLMMQVTGLDGGSLGLTGLLARLVFLILFVIAWLWSEQIISANGQINLEDFQL